MIYKALYRKLKIEQGERTKKRGSIQMLRRGMQFPYHYRAMVICDTDIPHRSNEIMMATV